MLDRVCCFVEEIVTFALSKQLPQFIWVTQIPIGNRKPALPTSVRACSPRRRINSVATDCYDFAIR
jgi:hypothetical protein